MGVLYELQEELHQGKGWSKQLLGGSREQEQAGQMQARAERASFAGRAGLQFPGRWKMAELGSGGRWEMGSERPVIESCCGVGKEGLIKGGEFGFRTGRGGRQLRVAMGI